MTADFHQWCMRARLDEENAKHWLSGLEELVATKTLEPGMASMCAGQLSFAVTVAADKCGRVYIRPFRAQAHAPLHGFRVRSLTRNCGEVVHPIPYNSAHAHPQSDGRKKIGTYLDRRSLKSVMVGSRGWMRRTLLIHWTGCTRMACASICFNERDDNYMGILECAAQVLAPHTFHDLVKSAI